MRRSWHRWVDNYFGVTYAYVSHRDGTKELVSFHCIESDGDCFCFRYPYRQHDYGMSVRPQYIRFPGLFEKIRIGIKHNGFRRATVGTFTLKRADVGAYILKHTTRESLKNGIIRNS